MHRSRCHRVILYHTLCAVQPACATRGRIVSTRFIDANKRAAPKIRARGSEGRLAASPPGNATEVERMPKFQPSVQTKIDLFLMICSYEHNASKSASGRP